MRKILTVLLVAGVILGCAGTLTVAAVLVHFGRTVPDHSQLKDYQPPVVTRLYAGDGRLLEEFASEKRVFVPVKAIPPRVVQAFLAAEDQNFYSHGGVDLTGIARAVVLNTLSDLRGEKRRPQGASTITQQVAKNFLLTNELSLDRKIKEAILAVRIESALSKDQILELYLNEIYLGLGSYGVAAAALNYFDKSLDELTIAEAAYLAALPKAPNNYHPVKNHDAAVGRRNWVLEHMRDQRYITRDEYRAALQEPLALRKPQETEITRAPYLAEDVRRFLMEKFGENAVYRGGLVVRTTVDPRLQQIGEKALRDGLIAYDRRKVGWRGPVERTGKGSPELAGFFTRANPLAYLGWQLAFVQSVSPGEARLLLQNWQTATLKAEGIKWTRQTDPAKILQTGDLVYVSHGKEHWQLEQVPAVNGGLVALDPHTGRILAMVGGFSYELSEFNRASQAARQPGSTFKPFVYLAALERDFTPSTIILDAPITIYPGPGQPAWRPANYTRKFYGPSPLRVGVEESRNLMTVRLARAVGIRPIKDVANRFGIYADMPPFYSAVLGSEESTLLTMTAAYAMLDNGGRKVVPTAIDRIQDRFGRTLWKHDTRICPGCAGIPWMPGEAPMIQDNRPAVTDPATAYQMVSILEGVVQRGTGTAIGKAIQKPLAGKTGTTNGYHDAWFVGFSPDLAVGVYIGYDQPKSLGSKETGGRVAAPVFQNFMEAALKDTPAKPFRIPPGIELVRVNAKNGQPAIFGDQNAILEAFKLNQNTDVQREIADTPADIAQGGTPEGTGLEPPAPVMAVPSGNAPEALGGIY